MSRANVIPWQRRSRPAASTPAARPCLAVRVEGFDGPLGRRVSQRVAELRAAGVGGGGQAGEVGAPFGVLDVGDPVGVGVSDGISHVRSERALAAASPPATRRAAGLDPPTHFEATALATGPRQVLRGNPGAACQ